MPCKGMGSHQTCGGFTCGCGWFLSVTQTIKRSVWAHDSGQWGFRLDRKCRTLGGPNPQFAFLGTRTSSCSSGYRRKNRTIPAPKRIFQWNSEATFPQNLDMGFLFWNPTKLKKNHFHPVQPGESMAIAISNCAGGTVLLLTLALSATEQEKTALTSWTVATLTCADWLPRDTQTRKVSRNCLFSVSCGRKGPQGPSSVFCMMQYSEKSASSGSFLGKHKKLTRFLKCQKKMLGLGVPTAKSNSPLTTHPTKSWHKMSAQEGF